MKSKLLIGALLFSIALNIFIIGVVLGRVGTVKESVKELNPNRVELNIRQVGAHLPKALRRQARRQLMAKTPELKGVFDERRAKELEIKELLEAETLDVEALTAAVDRWQDLSAFLRRVPRDVLLNVLPSASFEVRQEIAKSLFGPRDTAGSGHRGRRAGPPARPKNRPMGGPEGHPPPFGHAPPDGPPPDGPPPEGHPPVGHPPEGTPPEDSDPKKE